MITNDTLPSLDIQIGLLITWNMHTDFATKYTQVIIRNILTKQTLLRTSKSKLTMEDEIVTCTIVYNSFA